MSHLVIGIDPGVTGAIAAIYNGKLIEIIDMPVHDTRASGSEIASIIRDMAVAADDIEIYVENTQPMPRNGSIASFKLGLNTGIVCGVVETLGHPLHRVRPVEWKRKMGLIGKDKDASRGLARELFPDFRERLTLKKHDGRAEAALIARYGMITSLVATQ
jgi:crossover junction endodeoxyribonuclease RuvC